MIRYTLSSRQRKELYIRGAQIEIAIPAPPGDLRDALQFARDSLDSIDAEDVASAEECEVLVDPLQGRATPPATVTELLGAIVADGERDRGRPVISIAVVVATLRAGKVRHASPAVQWPATILVDGAPLLTGSRSNSDGFG